MSWAPPQSSLATTDTTDLGVTMHKLSIVALSTPMLVLAGCATTPAVPLASLPPVALEGDSALPPPIRNAARGEKAGGFLYMQYPYAETVTIDSGVNGLVEESDGGGTYIGQKEDCIGFDAAAGQYLDIRIDTRGFDADAILQQGNCGYGTRFMAQANNDNSPDHPIRLAFQAPSAGRYWVWLVVSGKHKGRAYTVYVNEMSAQRRAAFIESRRQRALARAQSRQESHGADLVGAFARGFNQQMAYMEDRDRETNRLLAEAQAMAERERAQQRAQAATDGSWRVLAPSHSSPSSSADQSPARSSAGESSTATYGGPPGQAAPPQGSRPPGVGEIDAAGGVPHSTAYQWCWVTVHSGKNTDPDFNITTYVSQVGQINYSNQTYSAWNNDDAWRAALRSHGISRWDSGANCFVESSRAAMDNYMNTVKSVTQGPNSKWVVLNWTPQGLIAGS